jgi:hypothetical protein
LLGIRVRLDLDFFPDPDILTGPGFGSESETGPTWDAENIADIYFVSFAES